MTTTTTTTERGLALDGLPWAQRLRALVRYAVLAPSNHNAQPWKVRIDENVLELLPDRSRSTPVCDPDDRELVIACGAFLFHLRIAARHFGWDITTTLLPDVESDVVRDLGIERATVMARVVFRERDDVDNQAEQLFQAIPARRTWRLPFAAVAVDAATATRLNSAVALEGAQLALISDQPRRLSLARLVATADEKQWRDGAFREELASWCHAAGSDRRDGLPGQALGQGDIVSMVAPLVVRTFDLGASRAARDEELAHGSPLLAVIITEGDRERDWLIAGAALDRLLLTAARYGLAASFLNQCIEVPVLRRRVAEVVGTKGIPQLMLRIGRPLGKTPPMTPRRPIEEFLLPTEPATPTAQP
ncbi:MAG: nitroreductase [Deltaproteobacteria bacterium]|nr:nitroreductase [Deltaproteobacteria bacterium]